MAIKPPADDAKFSQAKADVEAAGGKVIHEIKTGFKALIISLPNHQVWTFDNKDYIDFMEQDQEGECAKIHASFLVNAH